MLLAFALATLRTIEVVGPNYGATLLPPFENTDLVPRLYPARPPREIRIGVVPDEKLVTDERLGIVRLACAKWAYAAWTQGGGLKFVFVSFRRTGDADVVFSFHRMNEGGTHRGFSEERQRWASLCLAVEASEGRLLPPRDVLRVATYELGHALGIWGHSPDSHDVMSLCPEATEVTTCDMNTLRVAYQPDPIERRNACGSRTRRDR